MKLALTTLAVNLVLLFPSSCRSKEVLPAPRTVIIPLSPGASYPQVAQGDTLEFVLPIPRPPRAYDITFTNGISPCSASYLKGDTQSHPSCVVNKSPGTDTTYSFTFREGLVNGTPIPGNIVVCHHC